MENIVTYFETLFGSYEPIQTLISGSVENGDAVYEISTNWGYIGSVVGFLIVLYCVLRIFGAVISNK